MHLAQVADLTAAAVALGSLVVGAAGYWFLERTRKTAANQRREDIIRDAEREAETVKKAAELAAREELLTRRTELDAENSRLREDQNQRVTDLDRRERSLNEQQDGFKKREKMLEGTQKTLADRQKVIDSRETELERVLDDEQEQLYKISGLEADAAKEMLLAERHNLHLPDTKLENTLEARLAIAQKIRDLRPHVVILPYWHARHPDHYRCSQLGYEACFLAGFDGAVICGQRWAFPHRRGPRLSPDRAVPVRARARRCAGRTACH